MTNKILRLMLISTISVLIFSGNTWGQTTWGSITGYVTDPTGASVPRRKDNYIQREDGRAVQKCRGFSRPIQCHSS